MVIRCHSTKRSWRYCLGAGTSLVVGGYLGSLVYRASFRFVFGPEPFDGFLRTIAQLSHGPGLAVGVAVVLTKNALWVVGGLIVYTLYDRSLGRKRRGRRQPETDAQAKTSLPDGSSRKSAAHP